MEMKRTVFVHIYIYVPQRGLHPINHFKRVGNICLYLTAFPLLALKNLVPVWLSETLVMGGEGVQR